MKYYIQKDKWMMCIIRYKN